MATAKIPSTYECIALLRKYRVPQNIVAHSKKVNEVSMFLAKKINERGVKVNLELVNAASLLHDIDKIRDIKSGAGRHGELSRKILEKEGYPQVAKIAEKHVLRAILDDSGSALSGIEEKIVFYADKRVIRDKTTALSERFGYFRKTYPQYHESINRAEPLVKKLEAELMDAAGLGADFTLSGIRDTNR